MNTGILRLLLATAGTLGSAVAIIIVTFVLDAGFHPTDRTVAAWVIVTLVLMAVTLLVSYRLTQTLRRRLYEIEEAAVLIGSGRLHQRVTSMGDKDEIESLANQFNLMGERIEEQVVLLRRLAEENRQLAADAERAAALDERQRLARELHDSVSQQIFAISMLAASAARQLEQSSSTLPRTLEQLSELANAAQREMRGLLLHLRPVDLDGRTFDEAAQAFLAAIQERHQLPFVFESEVHHPLSPAVEEQLFRILQEAIANVLKHASAEHIEVRLDETSQNWRMLVLDDGRGMSGTSGGDGYGLNAMRERASSLGGSLTFWNREKGTAVEVLIPIIA